MSSGLLATNNINCHNAYEIGCKLLENNVEKAFADLKLKRNDRVLSIAHMNKNVKIGNQQSTVNPVQLFSRIICVAKSQEDRKECFKYELSQYPCLIFDEISMGKNAKSSFLEYFYKKLAPTNILPEGKNIFVIDGGFLLRKVVWQA